MTPRRWCWSRRCRRSTASDRSRSAAARRGAVRIEIDPAPLFHYGIGLEDVRAAIAAANAHSPKGAIEDGTRRWQLYANDQATTPDDYKPLVIAYRNGAPVRLSDVAKVEEGQESRRNIGLSNGKPAVLVILNRQPGGNIIDAVDRVIEMLPQLRAALPSDIDLAVALDRSTTIRASLHEVEITLVIAVVLVILVVFLFLRQCAGGADPERRGAGVAARHVRGDAPARLQPQQLVPDGADDRGRVCGR